MAAPSVKHSVLEQRNPDIDGAEAERLLDYDSLYSGGQKLESRLPRLLPRRPAEEHDTYKFRLQSYHHVPYAGSLVDYFATWLFTGKLETRLVSGDGNKGDPPDWFAAWKEDVDLQGTNLPTMLRDLMVRAFVKRRAWLQIDTPRAPVTEDGHTIEPANRKEHAEMGLDRAYVCVLDADEVLDWECDDDGELAFVIRKHRDERRQGPFGDRDMITDSWTIYTPQGWFRYAKTYKRDEPPSPTDDIPLVAQGPSPTPNRVPFIHLCLKEGLWAMNRIYSPALEQFRKRNALSWSIDRTCYAMRIFKLKGTAPAGPGDDGPVHGPAIGIVIGTDEDIAWDAPPSEAFAPIADYIGNLKDEVYRVFGAMALGVDNNAAAIGRSGESKAVDAKLAEIVLKAYGGIVVEVVESLLDMLSEARGDADEWHVSGMDTFTSADAGVVLENAALFDQLAIPSKRARVLLHQQVSRVVLPNASQQDIDMINLEIESGTTDEEMQAVRDKARGVLPIDPNAEDPDELEEEDDEPPPKKTVKKAAKK